MKWENTQTQRILVVDDNRRIHEDFDLVFFNRQRNLELEADENEIYGHLEPPAVAKPTYELDHAFSGQEGIEKARSALDEGRPYQVAFVDIRMPGIDGVETIKRIWAIDPRVQMVICTAFADYRWEDLARHLGQSDKLLVLKKPFDHIEAFQLACTLSEKWFLTRHAALKFEQMELLVAQRTQRILDLQRGEAQRANELGQMKLRLLSNLAAELGEPANLILNRLERMRGRKPASPEEALVVRNAKRLAGLAEDCVTVNRLNEGDLLLQITETGVPEFLHRVVAALKPVANRKRIHFELPTNGANPLVRFDAGKLEKALASLLSLALEMMPENGQIIVQAGLHDGNLHLVGLAAGATEGSASPGIEPTKEISGPRLGLAQELVSLAGGMLTWEFPIANADPSAKNSDGRFSIRLPLVDASLPTHTATETEPPDSPVGSSPVSTSEEESSMKELPLILLAMEDTGLAQEIQQGFGQEYRTILLKDGTQGLIQAREMLPDVIIAEVALQILDGIELCRKLKNDELTSHIPVILMADRDWESGQLRALEAGADDYLHRPFKLSLLKARVDNLRGSRHKLLELFRQVKDLYPRDIAANQSDAKFIRRVIDLVDENMSDCDFDLEIMARKLAVSRRQLFRKLRAAAGCSPNTFIRTLRLKRAAQLLTESQMTVTEITYAVGFSDLKYFRNIFREYFGVAPGEFLKRSKTQ